MHKSKTFMLYLFSYCSFLILGSCFIYFYQNYFISIFRTELSNQQATINEQMVNTIEAELEQLLRMNYQLSSSNQNLVSYTLMSDSPIKDQKIVNELYDSVSINPIISMISLYKNNSDKVYTSDGTCSNSYFFNTLFKFDDSQKISKLTKHVALTATSPVTDEKYLVFTYPSGTFSNFADTTIMIFIKETNVTKLLKSSKESNTYHLILNANYNVLASNQMSDEIKPIIKILKKENIISASSEQTDAYTYYAKYSLISDLILVSIFTTESDLLPLKSLQRNFMLILIIFLLIGIVMVIYYMKTTYTPIKKLSIYGEKILGNIANMNAITTIQDAIEHLSSQNTNLNDALKDNIALKDSLLFSLIKGKVSSRAEFANLGKYLGICLGKQYYGILLVSFTKSETEEVNRDHIDTLFKNTLTQGYEYHLRESFKENGYIVILGTDTLDQSGLEEVLEKVIENYKLEYEKNVSITVSNFYEEINLMPKAYFEATIASRELFLGKWKNIIFFNKIEHLFSNMEYPSEQITKLTKSINKSDISTIRMEINDMLNYFKENHIPSIFAEHLCYNITYFLLKRFNQEIYNAKFDMIILYYVDCIDSFSKHVNDLLDELEKKNIALEEGTSELTIFDRIKEYIDENYNSYNFSVQEVANVLAINSSYMSQLFKNQTNITILDYITDLRMEKAKSLLESTNIPLTLVAEEVGYYNVNSFIRRFKQITGLTPGEYRKNSVTIS